MGSGFKPLPVFAWGVAFLSFAAIAFTVHHLRINAAQPETQSELDASRGEQPSPEWPLLEIEKKNDAYYAQATGISYRKEHCGTQVEDAVLLAMSRTFADSVMVMLAHEASCAVSRMRLSFLLLTCPLTAAPSATATRLSLIQRWLGS